MPPHTGSARAPASTSSSNNLSGWAHTAGIIKVMSDGTPWRPLVHIEDISRAALAAATAPREAVHNQAFNVGRNDANYQVRDIAEAVKAAFPRRQSGDHR